MNCLCSWHRKPWMPLGTVASAPDAHALPRWRLWDQQCHGRYEEGLTPKKPRVFAVAEVTTTESASRNKYVCIYVFLPCPSSVHDPAHGLPAWATQAGQSRWAEPCPLTDPESSCQISMGFGVCFLAWGRPGHSVAACPPRLDVNTESLPFG